MGYIFGGQLFWLLIIIALWFIIKAITKNIRIKPAILSVVYLTFSLVLLITMDMSSIEEEKAETQIKIMIHAFINDEDVSKVVFHEEDYGKMTALLKALQKYYTELQINQTEMNNAVNDCMLDKALNIESFKDSQKIKELRDNVNNAIMVLKNNEIKREQQVDQLIDEIEGMNINNNYKANFISGILNGSNKNSNETETINNNLICYFSKIVDILQFVEERKEKISFGENQINFEDTNDMNRYNQLVSDLDEYQNKVNELQEGLQARKDKLIKDIAG